MYKNILYFGVYSHGNPRNAIIIKGLRSRGHTVIECRVRPGFLPFMYVRLLWHYLRMRPRFDRMIVGFPGAEVMLLAKMLTRKPIVFDAFSSAYLAYIIDRKYWKIGSLRNVWYRFIDRWSCRLADAVLLDTNAQINYFVREFRVSRNKFFKVLIGTDTDIFKPSTSHRSPSVCRLHFHGTYIPLQGIEHIIDAASGILALGIELEIVGDGKIKPAILARAHALGVAHRNVLPANLAYDALAQSVAHAAICLGIFGDSIKAQLVIPNKIYEYAAMKKPIITLDTPAIRELFDEQSMVLLSDARPETIISAVARLKDNLKLCAELSERAYAISMQNATPEIIGRRVEEIINTV